MIDGLSYSYDDEPKERLADCNLCGATQFAALAHHDRYEFAARSLACLRCGLVFLSPRMTAEAYGRFYETVYRPLVSAYHGRRIDAETVEADQRPYAKRLAALLEPFVERSSGGTILDVGGSTGVVSEEVASQLAMQALVLDPAPAEVARAQARGLDGIVGTIETWDGGGRRYELILLCQTIDHLLDVSGSLRRLRAIVADDGLLFVDIVDFRAGLLRNWSVEAATKIDHPFSLTEATAEAYLVRAGFEIVFRDYAPDHLHVGYVCRPADPRADALPDPATVRRFFDELRYVQNAPHP